MGLSIKAKGVATSYGSTKTVLGCNVIALSSFRPLSKCSPNRQQQFIQAKESWERVFREIHYFNSFEPSLAGPTTQFIVRDNPDERPPIALMAAHAARQREWVALINADIVIMEKMAGADAALEKFRGQCALSRRLESLTSPHPTDWGLDFFLAIPAVWAAVAAQIPPVFSLGRVRWDSWISAFFARRYGDFCYDLTPMRLVFHPPHEERADQNMPDPPDFYLQHPAYPQRRLRF